MKLDKRRAWDVRRVFSGTRRRLLGVIQKYSILKSKPSRRRRLLSYSIVEDETSFSDLQSDWEDLFQRAISQTPFLRYSWSQQSWRHQRSSEGKSLFIVVVRRHERPVLIAPLVRRGRRLSFLDSATPQYNDVLVDSADVSMYVDFFWRHLARIRSVSQLVAKWVRDDSPLADHLATAQQVSKTVTNRAPFMDLTTFTDWDDYLRSLSSKLRQSYRRRLRNLQQRGSVEFRMANAATCARDMAWLFAQKREWLDRAGKSSKWLKARATEDFFTKAALEGLDSGQTWLSVLSVDGTPIATILAFQEGSTLFGSKDAYDPAWHVYSPGQLLKLMTFERAFQVGVRKIDLMIGGYAWKDEFATGRVSVRNRKIRIRSQKALQSAEELKSSCLAAN
jgi:CelD/BcsL family acetyltransferase involved in cellulose biosynthesis